VQQLVAQPFQFGLREVPVQAERLGPDEQVVREADDLQPGLVHREVLERELAQTGRLVLTDAVLDVCVLAVPALDHADIGVGLVGQDRLEVVPVHVGERQLRAGVRPFTADDHPATHRPCAEIELARDLSDLTIATLAAVRVARRDPTVLRDLQNLRTDLLAEVIANGEPQVAVSAVINEAVSRAGRIRPDQDLKGHRRVILCGVRPRIPRPEQTTERLAGLIQICLQRMESVAALVVPGRLLLLGVRVDQCRVHIDRELLRGAVKLPEPGARLGMRGTEKCRN
jgi:hypothetical protein